MMNSKPQVDFMTMGDEDFANTIICSAVTISQVYPDSHLYVYDWGLSELSKEELRQIGNCEIIDWKENLAYDLPHFESLKLSIENTITNNKPTEYIFEKWLGYSFQSLEKKKDFYMCQKPQCILDCFDRTNNSLVFLDGDAILIDSIDEELENEFDVGVTLRPKIQIERMSNDGVEMLLNAGVIIFNCLPEKAKIFVESWLDQIDQMDVFGLREQTALSKLIRRSNEGIFDGYYNVGNLDIQSRTVSIRVLPCEKYNYYWVEKGYDPNRSKILHFKAGAHNDETHKKVIKSIKNGDVDEWGWEV